MGYVLCTPGLLFRNYQFSSCLGLPSQYLLSTYLTWSKRSHLQPTTGLRARLSAKHHGTQHNPETQLMCQPQVPANGVQDQGPAGAQSTRWTRTRRQLCLSCPRESGGQRRGTASHVESRTEQRPRRIQHAVKKWEDPSLPGGTVVRVRLPVQGTQVRSPVREDSTGGKATNPAHCNYWASHLEPVLHDKRGHGNEKPVHLTEG